ncbi:MAG: glycoside hydrolase family 16 protein, partial [Victivallis vadensis]
DENKMEFFIDNRKTFEVMRNPEEPWCVDIPQYIILNHAVGRHSGPVPDDVSEMSFYVDYVRVYQ